MYINVSLSTCVICIFLYNAPTHMSIYTILFAFIPNPLLPFFFLLSPLPSFCLPSHGFLPLSLLESRSPRVPLTAASLKTNTAASTAHRGCLVFGPPTERTTRKLMYTKLESLIIYLSKCKLKRIIHN